jgi:hypothetical protein
MVKGGETVTACGSSVPGLMVFYPRAKVLPKQLRKDAAHASKTNYADRSIDAEGLGTK